MSDPQEPNFDPYMNQCLAEQKQQAPTASKEEETPVNTGDTP